MYTVLTNGGGRRSMMRLSERMMMSFCTAVGASTANTWTLLTVAGEDVRVMTRKSVDDPGRPSGIVLSAATSLWLPLPSTTVFSFLRSENSRNQVMYTIPLLVTSYNYISPFIIQYLANLTKISEK